MPMAHFVANATLGHLLQLLDGHLELSLTKGRNSGSCDGKRLSTSLSISTRELFALFGLDGLPLGLLLLLQDRTQDLCSLMFLKDALQA